MVRSQFPYFKEQIERAADNGNLRKCTEKMKLLPDSFESRFCDFAKEEDWILASIHPLLVNKTQLKH